MMFLFLVAVLSSMDFLLRPMARLFPVRPIVRLCFISFDVSRGIDSLFLIMVIPTVFGFVLLLFVVTSLLRDPVNLYRPILEHLMIFVLHFLDFRAGAGHWFFAKEGMSESLLA